MQHELRVSHWDSENHLELSVSLSGSFFFFFFFFRDFRRFIHSVPRFDASADMLARHGDAQGQKPSQSTVRTSRKRPYPRQKLLVASRGPDAVIVGRHKGLVGAVDGRAIAVHFLFE